MLLTGIKKIKEDALALKKLTQGTLFHIFQMSSYWMSTSLFHLTSFLWNSWSVQSLIVCSWKQSRICDGLWGDFCTHSKKEYGAINWHSCFTQLVCSSNGFHKFLLYPLRSYTLGMGGTPRPVLAHKRTLGLDFITHQKT